MEHASNESKRILVSVVICAYNRKDFIHNAIKSVQNQNFDMRCLEIVIVTNYEIEKFNELMADSNCDIKILKGYDEPLGLYYTRAINSARGSIISFLDDDDEFSPEKLNYIVDEFNKDPNLVFVNNDVHIIDSQEIQLSAMDNDFRFRSGRTKSLFLNIKKSNDCYNAIRKHGNFCNSSISIKTSNIKEYIDQLKDVSGAEDDFLFFSSLFSGGNMLISEKRLTYYRIHNQNKSTYVKIDLDQAMQRMQLEMPKALNALKLSLLTLNNRKELQPNCCYNALVIYYEIL